MDESRRHELRKCIDALMTAISWIETDCNLPPSEKPKPFRAPTLIECCPSGDNRRWLWIMEMTRGKIFGKAFFISRSEEKCLGAGYFAQLKQGAYDEMMRRSLDDCNCEPEGAEWGRFL